MILIFQKKCGRPRGGRKIRTHADKGGKKNGQKFADILYGWPLRLSRDNTGPQAERKIRVQDPSSTHTMHKLKFGITLT